MNLKGRHVLADITTSEDIDDDHFVDLCHRAVEVSGMEVVDFNCHLFKPQGTTAIWILAESHFALHTFPEARYYSAECYTCGDSGKPMEAILALVDSLPVDNVVIKEIDRGGVNG